MGANTFFSTAKGATAKIAFSEATAEARYNYGHAGYTGSIAEKHDFVVIAVPDGVEPTDHADHLMDIDDERVSDKWGPAGCIALGNDNWLFFGWASS